MKTIKIPFLFLLFSLLVYSCETSNDEIVYLPEGPVFDEEFPITVLPSAADLRTSNTVFIEPIQKIIDATPSGEDLYINIFKFSQGTLRENILNAQRRGVNVHMILDSDEVNNYTAKVFQDSITTFVRYNNYLDSKAINHNKYVLSSAISTSDSLRRNVVLSTSYNFTAGDNSKYQDMVILSNEALYQSFLYNFNQMIEVEEEQTLQNWKFTWSETADYKVGFLPKQSGDDILMDVFDETSSSAKVVIMNSKWEDDRPQLVTTLKRLLDQGTTLTIIAPPSRTDNLDIAWENRLIEWRETYVNFTLQWISSPSLHNKTIYIEDGAKSAVWTGAHNLRARSLRFNNEVMLKVTDVKVLEAYKEWLDGVMSE
ncbi:phospholipase D-like domain-containing protein [Flammeovirga pacifica]|uniref:phospholipase D n=1 Tax=Flammeovirga pacifica TaxID=915059 RepID=A0A1S1YVN4_FLAPC|nr:phospholipase D-like domain-containing protein [Flammeovirga pacifica]OHX65098.1 hypothetical protein NH26_01390 [Flammeovirga pacifica]